MGTYAELRKKYLSGDAGRNQPSENRVVQTGSYEKQGTTLIGSDGGVMPNLNQKSAQWLKTASFGLKAYESDKARKLAFGSSKEGKQQQRIERMAADPLMDANPFYFNMVKQYAEDTSYKEIGDNWTEDQKQEFGYLYASDKKQAEEYAIRLNNALKAATKNEQRKGVAQKATDSPLSGAWETAKAIGANTLGIGEYVTDMAEYAARGRITEKSDRLSPVEYAQTVTGSIADKLNGVDAFGVAHKVIDERVPVFGGKGWGDVYQLGTSIAQSMASGHLLGSTGTLISYFGSAAASGIDDAKSRGATDEQAVAIGTLQGIAEGLAEKIGVDSLFKRGAVDSIRGFMRNVAAQAGSEGIEEGLTSLFNNISENIVMGENSLFYDRVNGYVESGMEEGAARKRAWLDSAEEIIFDAVAGAASGGITGGLETGARTALYGLDFSGEDVSIQDTAIISDALKKFGETENVEAVAAAAVKAAAGQKLTIGERKILKNSLLGEWMVNTIRSDSLRDDPSGKMGSIASAHADSWTQAAKSFADVSMRTVTEPTQEPSVAKDGENTPTEEMKPTEGAQKVPVATPTADKIAAVSGSRSTQEPSNATELSGKSTLGNDNATPVLDNTNQGLDNATAEDSSDVDTVRTVQISTGEPVEITKISAVDKNGGMTFQLSDGRNVDASDIQHRSEGEAVLYEAVADLGASAQIADILVNNWKNDPGGVSAEVYTAGMLEAFNYGRYHIPESEMASNETISRLTSVQSSSAYALGKTFGSELLQTKEANIRRAGAATRAQKASNAAVQKVATTAAAGSSEVPTTGAGKIHFDRQGRTLSAVQETGLKTMEQLSQLFGTEFHVFESYEKDGKRVFRDENGEEQNAPNGWYDPDTGHIHIDLNAGSGGRGTMLFTVAHELTHFIRDWSPAKFDKLAEAVFELVYKEKNISVVELVRKQQAKAARNGMELSFDEAYEEVVADSMESILTSGNVVELMAEVKQQDQSLWQKIRKWFQNLAEDIRKVIDTYSGFKPDSAEGRAVAAMEDVLPILEGFYMDALQEASSNYQTAEGQKNTTQEGGVKYSIPYRDAIDLLADSALDRKTNSHLLVSDHTPKVYIDKADAKDQKIIMGWDIAYLAMNKSGDIPGNYHGLGRDVMKNLPEALEDPLYVVKQNNGRVAAVTEIVVKKNRSVVVSVEFDAFKSTVQDGENQSDNYNIIVTAMDAKPNYLQNTILSGNIVYNKNNENPANFILWLKSLNKALPNDDLARSSNSSIRNSEGEVNKKFSQRDPLQEKAVKALEKENAQLKEDVQGLKDLVKLQSKLTGGKMVKPASVESAARALKKKTGAIGNTKELAKLLGEFYAYIANGEELTWEGVQEAAQEAAEWLRNNRKQIIDEYSAEILRDLRTRGVSFNEDQKSEAAVTHDTFANYRKAMFGSVKITENGMPLDEAWHDLAGLYPSVFPRDTNSGDMPRLLVEIVDRLHNGNGISQEYDEAMVRQGLIREVYDSYWNVSALYTVADVKQKEINELKSHHAQRMSDLQTKHREKVEQLHLEQNAAVEAVRAAERQRSQERTRKALDKHRENQKQVQANRAERHGKTKVRRRIRKAVMELDKLLNWGDKKKNVKDGMSEMVSKSLKLAEALFMDEYSNRDMLRNGVGIQMTDAEEKLFQEAKQFMESIESGAVIEGMEFDGEIDAMEQMKKLDGKLSGKMTQLKDVFARERKRLYGTTVSELLGQLADEYSRLSEAEDGAIRAAKDENVYAHLLQLQKDVGGTTVRDMNLNQLEQVADAYTMVLTTVRNANKMFAKNLKFKRDALAGMVMGEIGAAAKKISKLASPGKDAADRFSWNNLKPVYAFERLGSQTMKTLFGNIRKGQDVWAVDMQEADSFRRDQYKKHKRKDWDMEKQYSFEFESGKVDLSLEQIMSLYAYSRREAALDHLLKGGFVFGGSTEVFVKKNGIKRRYLKKDATAYNLSADELLQVIDSLTKEQKAFVEEMQTYLSDVMGGKGNEVSMQMYGIKSFGEKNYFPLRSAGQYMEKAKEDSFRKEQGQISIVNSGFTKATTPHASNPITLDGFMDVWAEHVNDMAMYHGFVLPMEDFRRVYNYSSPNIEEGNSQSVNATIENAFGKAATGYIDQLYKDLNGGAVGDNRENLSKKLVSLHKKAAVFASASVVIQQPSAIVRAFALIDPRHFIGPKVDHKRHKLLWEEVKKYAPVAFVKEMGYFDTGMGRSAKDFLQTEEYSGIREKMTALFKDADYRDEILGKAPALADEITWCSIWEAVKRETKAKNPGINVKSDAFLQIAGERFGEVIDKTQVYDSVLSRSANMRSKSGLMNMITSFMAEPTTSINMLEDALRKGDRKQLKRTVGAVYGSVLLNSLLVSLVYAARDDDEDETYWEKYLSSLAVEMVDGINPITYYPFLRDVWSIGQGFDVERADMTLITDFADAAKKVVQSAKKVQEASEEEEQAAMAELKDSLWGMVDNVASLTGLPVKNIRRDIEGAVNLYKTISTDLTGRKTTALSLRDTVMADVMASIPIGDLLYGKNKRDRLYGAIKAGDTAYVQRLRAGYKTDDSYHTAIKQALRDNDSRIWEAAVAWNSGNLNDYLRIAKEIRSENRFKQDDIVLAIRAEASSMVEKERDSSDKVYGYFTAEKFGVAISQNNTTMANIIKTDLIDTAIANGKTRDKAEENFVSSATNSCKTVFLEGDITESQAINALVIYCGKEEDKARDTVADWKIKADNPDSDLSADAIKKYQHEVASSGISLAQYEEYRNAVSGITGEGKKKRRMDVINSMPISAAQKDALYFSEGWSKSTLYEAPWH